MLSIPGPSALKPLRFYLLAGVGTAPNFMGGLQEDLRRRFAEAGFRAEGSLLFPYRDWSRRMLPQIREVWHDIRLPQDRLDRSIGGRQAAERILADIGEDAPSVPLVLLGHSGGGTAALHAAYRMERTSGGIGGRIRAIVQIGSPRSPVPPELRGRTAYCYAVRVNGRRKDPVCLAGSWSTLDRRDRQSGLDERDGGPLIQPHRIRPGRRWRRQTMPPGTLFALPLLGGHPDYFRTHLADSRGRTNLELTLEAAWGFIMDRLGDQLSN
ncbi:hypothetical protein [Gorillibacterium sp. sgz5001074]|uniref:hypothetical protein n=1 Tax=Gorillibacterium sp. sgz5001074 TaxID=3446695 RepID=UPI003F676B09